MAKKTSTMTLVRRNLRARERAIDTLHNDERCASSRGEACLQRWAWLHARAALT
jgi:hypothetical protein